jgi:hypothetical protein
VRAVGNLLAALSPDLAPQLQAAAAAGDGAHAGPVPLAGGGGSAPGGSAAAGGFSLDAWLGSALTCLQSCLTSGGMKVCVPAQNGGPLLFPLWEAMVSSKRPFAHTEFAKGAATACLVSTRSGAVERLLWRGSVRLVFKLNRLALPFFIQVQWNACYAAHGLLRNGPLRAHAVVEARVSPMLLLLVMLVRAVGLAGNRDRRL